MSCIIHALHLIDLDGQKLGPFTTTQLVRLHKAIAMELNPDLRIDGDTVVQAICHYFGIPRSRLLSRERTERIAWPRQLAMYFVWTTSGFSSTEVGRLFRRDHGTVLHARTTVEQRANEKRFKNQIDELRERLKPEQPPQPIEEKARPSSNIASLPVTHQATNSLCAISRCPKVRAKTQPTP